MEDLNLETIEALLRDASDLIVSYAFSVVGAIAIVILGFILAGIAKRWTRSGLARMDNGDPTLTSFLSNIIYYGILIVFGVAVLGQFGIQTASILAALGAAGLAIGLALQGTLQNVAAGVMLLLLRPFRVGEYVEAGNVQGTIVDIGLFATELKSVDGLFILTPNQELWNVPVTNYSRHATRRNDLTIGIGYDDDIAVAEAILMRLAKADDRVLETPAPQTFVAELGDSAVSVTLRYWTKTADHLATAQSLTKQAKIAFDEAGISIPYPQQDMHLFERVKEDSE